MDHQQPHHDTLQAINMSQCRTGQRPQRLGRDFSFDVALPDDDLPQLLFNAFQNPSFDRISPFQLGGGNEA